MQRSETAKTESAELRSCQALRLSGAYKQLYPLLASGCRAWACVFWKQLRKREKKRMSSSNIVYVCEVRLDTHTNIQPHKHTYTNTPKYTQKHTQTQTHTHKHTRTRTHTHKHTHTHEHRHTQTNTHIRAQTHTTTKLQTTKHTPKHTQPHKHTQAHTKTHTHKQDGSAETGKDPTEDDLIIPRDHFGATKYRGIISLPVTNYIILIKKGESHVAGPGPQRGRHNQC